MRGADAFDRKTEGVHKGADVAETRDKPLKSFAILIKIIVFQGFHLAMTRRG